MTRGPCQKRYPHSVISHPPSRLCEDPRLNPTEHLRQGSLSVSLLGHRAGWSRQGWTWRGRWQTPFALPLPPGWLAEMSHFGDEPQCIQQGKFPVQILGRGCHTVSFRARGCVRLPCGFWLCFVPLCWDMGELVTECCAVTQGLSEQSGKLVRHEARLRARSLFQSRPELPKLCYLTKRRSE